MYYVLHIHVYFIWNITILYPNHNYIYIYINIYILDNALYIDSSNDILLLLLLFYLVESFHPIQKLR